MAGYSIREANQTDAKKIYELMQQKAAEEETTIPAHLTPEGFVESVWGPAAVFVGFVAEQERSTEGELKGYIMAHRAYSTWEGRSMFIREVFVIPTARHSGLALQLCRRLIQAAKNMGCRRCDVLVDTANKAALNLFEKLGAKNLTEAEDWHLFSMDKKAMEDMQANCTDQDPPRIRQASPKDFPDVRAMIQELADYEKMPHGPKIDADTLVTDASLPSNFFECFVAESNKGLVGYMLLYHTCSSQGRGIYMEDLYVMPDHRHKGYGTALMTLAAKHGLTLGANCLQFSVLSWNTPSIAFYQTKGATNLTVGRSIHVYRFAELS